MEKPLNDRMVDVSQKDIVKPSAIDDAKNIVATLLGWDKTTPIPATIENRVNELNVYPSPFKQYENRIEDSLHRYHAFYKKHMPYNRRV